MVLVNACPTPRDQQPKGFETRGSPNFLSFPTSGLVMRAEKIGMYFGFKVSNFGLIVSQIQ